MSQLIHQTPIMMKIQEELNKGRTLGDTSAGAMIIGEMKELNEKHDKEVEELRKEMEEALMANDEELRLELDEDRRKLEGMMARAEEDRKTLEKMRKPRETQGAVDTAQKSNSGQMKTYETSTTESDVVWVPEEPQGEQEYDSDQAMATFGLTLMAGTAIAVAGPVVGVGLAGLAVVRLIKERERRHGHNT